MNNPSEINVWQQVERLKTQLQRHSIDPGIYRAEQARQTWFQIGDNNNKYC